MPAAESVLTDDDPPDVEPAELPLEPELELLPQPVTTAATEIRRTRARFMAEASFREGSASPHGCSGHPGTPSHSR